MKKRTISLMLVGAMVATMFAGCGNSEANTNASSTEAGKTGGAEAGTYLFRFIQLKQERMICSRN